MPMISAHSVARLPSPGVGACRPRARTSSGAFPAPRSRRQDVSQRVTVSRLLRTGAALLLACSLMPVVGGTADAAVLPALTRYPYLTDSIQNSITVNWATDQSATAGSIQWGPVGSCSANTTAASRTSIKVINTAEYQW